MQLTELTTLAEDLDFRAACSYVEDLGRLGSRPGMERISRLCDILQNPQDDLCFIHIAGTNGKGSTGAMIASVLACGGVRTGMYYSPAMTQISDHYMINAETISERDYARYVSIVAAANEKLISETKESATQFEFETAVAFVYFRENHCGAVVLECGMGGRDDATNIVKNKICCVLASISYDHMQYLGNTLSEIARVKSGIIVSDCPVIVLDSSSESTDVIRKRCEETGSRLYVVKPSDIYSDEMFPHGQSVTYKENEDMNIRLCGTFQAENAALALQTITAIRDDGLIKECDLSEDVIRQGMKKARWPFRFEVISNCPLTIVDGAHNADAAIKLADSIRRYLRGYELILVMGVFADKEYDKIAKTLASLAKAVITVATPDNNRALDATALAKCVRKYCDDTRACGSMEEAYERAKEKAGSSKAAVVACGSLSYLKQFADIVLERLDEQS